MKSFYSRIICFLGIVFLATGLCATTVPFSQVGNTSKSSNTGSGDHWLSASITASNWKFVSRTKTGGNTSSWTSDSDTNKTASFNLIYDPGSFSMSISGSAKPFGGSGGEVISYFNVDKDVTLNYAISPNPPANVACGENSESLSMKENGTTTVEAYWKAIISGGPGDYGTSLASSYTFSNETPGAYTISAKRDDAECSTTINNVGVASISGHGKTSTKESADQLGSSETIYSAPYIDASLSATAVPSGASWPNDEPTWHCECLWPFCDHITASGATATFNSSGTGDYVVRCECGDSYKKIKIENIVPKLYSVEFTDDITIKRDTGTQTAYSGAAWKDENLDGDANDSGDIKYPIAYVSTNKCKVASAVFKLPGSKSYDVSFSAKLRFDTSFWSSYSSIVTGSASGSTITCSSVQFPDAFESSEEVGYNNSFSTRWDISFNNGDNWSDIEGESSNELYLTWKSGPSTAFETVLHIGCTKANGETSRDSILSDIWSEFTDCSVRVKGTTTDMTYWGSAATSTAYGSPQGTAQLLKLGGGRCGDWAIFFEDILSTQGITNVNVFGIEVGTPSVGFLVKNWSFSGSGTSGDSDFPYLFSSEVTDMTGVAGQGNSNPKSDFSNHALIWDSSNSKLYDPSYGSTPISGTSKDNAVATYQTNAFAGFYYGITPVYATNDNTAFALDTF